MLILRRSLYGDSIKIYTVKMYRRYVTRHRNNYGNKVSKLVSTKHNLTWVYKKVTISIRSRLRNRTLDQVTTTSKISKIIRKHRFLVIKHILKSLIHFIEVPVLLTFLVSTLEVRGESETHVYLCIYILNTYIRI